MNMEVRMRQRPLAWTLIGVVLTAGILVAPIRPADAGPCGIYRLFIRPSHTIGAEPLQSVPEVNQGFMVTGGRTRPILEAFCAPSDFSGISSTAEPGRWVVLSGVLIAPSVQCPDDTLVVFISRPTIFGFQILRGCLATLPEVVSVTPRLNGLDPTFFTAEFIDLPGNRANEQTPTSS